MLIYYLDGMRVWERMSEGGDGGGGMVYILWRSFLGVECEMDGARGCGWMDGWIDGVTGCWWV